MLCLMTTPAISALSQQDLGEVNILTQSEFKALFMPTASKQVTIDIVDVVHSYEFEISEDNCLKADVELSFSIIVGEEIYSFDLYGVVDAFELSSGDTLWEGPLFGNELVNGIECLVNASFSKLASGPEIQVCVAIQPSTDMSGLGLVVISFGDNVLTPEMIDEQRNALGGVLDVTTSAEISSETQLAETELNAIDERYVLIPYSTQIAYYNQMSGLEAVSGCSQISKAYYYEDAARVAISITSNSKKLNQYYAERLPASLGYNIQYTMVRNIGIQLSWYEYSWDENLTYIAGMQPFSQSDYANSGSTVLLKAFFDDAMDILGVSTATLSALFGEDLDGVLEGKLSCECGWDNAFVDITIGAYDYANFDLADPSLAVVFQLDTANSGDNVHGTYTYNNSITYQTLVYTYNDSGFPVPNILYNATPNTSYTFTVNVP